jgi:uncharacterized membrane protein YphA (DoxX/SURF4 family)
MAKSWFYRNIAELKSAARIIFGIVWLIDGTLKLQPSFAQNFSNIITNAATGQPSWLVGWFRFWAAATSVNPVFFAYMITFLEFSLAFCLIFGFMRKIGYAGGLLFSLVIWSVPEALGGPYGPSSTDIGTGIIYALVFLMLIIVNVLGGSSKYSLDAWIEKKVKWWHNLAEFR